MDPEFDMSDHVLTRPRFDNILNLRDVGKTVNQYTRQKYYNLMHSLMIEGFLYRSARPDDATLSDRRRLQDDYALRTIMDLRTKSEHDKQAKKRQTDTRTPALLQSNDALAEPLKIPGIKYLEINLNGKGFERSLLWKLSFWSFLKLIFLMILGYRMQAISILGREVLQPRGLIGLGHDSIDFCGPEIAQAFQEFASAFRYPMLVHCTQGKDRTGLLVALILFLLGVPLEAITYDYCLSESELLPEQESRLEEIKEIGLTEDFAKTPKIWIRELHQYLEQKYGGVRNYLSTIGVDSETQNIIVRVLQPIKLVVDNRVRHAM